MDVTITKGGDIDHVETIRHDGSIMRSTFPKKGPIPHDAVHYIVEQEIGLNKGFWGMVAQGHSPEAIQDIAKAAGHASASRAEIPEARIVELIQAERLVECFEADCWGAPADGETFRSVAQTACSYSFVATPELSDAMIERIRTRVSALMHDWTQQQEGGKFQFSWPDYPDTIVGNLPANIM